MKTNASVYLELFHGRRDPNEDLQDWGEVGPVFGPLVYVHTTYASELKFDAPGCEGAVLSVDDDMVFYDGVWYGDWSVFTGDLLDGGDGDLRARLTVFDPDKAILPRKDKR